MLASFVGDVSAAETRNERWRGRIVGMLSRATRHDDGWGTREAVATISEGVRSRVQGERREPVNGVRHAAAACEHTELQTDIRTEYVWRCHLTRRQVAETYLAVARRGVAGDLGRAADECPNSFAQKSNFARAQLVGKSLRLPSLCAAPASGKFTNTPQHIRGDPVRAGRSMTSAVEPTPRRGRLENCQTEVSHRHKWLVAGEMPAIACVHAPNLRGESHPPSRGRGRKGTESGAAGNGSLQPAMDCARHRNGRSRVGSRIAVNHRGAFKRETKRMRLPAEHGFEFPLLNERVDNGGGAGDAGEVFLHDESGLAARKTQTERFSVMLERLRRRIGDSGVTLNAVQKPDNVRVVHVGVSGSEAPGACTTTSPSVSNSGWTGSGIIG